MATIADSVYACGWKEVVAVYIDDNYGRNGISTLGDALASVGTKITIVHMHSDAGLKLISEAKDIGMLSTSYVWIATDWLFSVLDSGLLEADDMNSLQGLICLRPHTPNSGQQCVLRQRWKNLRTTLLVNVSLDAFGLYAYDSILMIAHSLNAYLNQGGKISFAEQCTLSSARGSKSELTTLKVFER
jgi:ionotropic glutamate receptor